MDISKPKRVTKYEVTITLTAEEARDYISNVHRLMANRTTVPHGIPADSPLFRMEKVCEEIRNMEEDEEDDV